MDRRQSEEPPLARKRSNALPGTMRIAGAAVQAISLRESQLWPIYPDLIAERDAFAPSRSINGLQERISGIG